MNKLALLAALVATQTGCASYHVEYEHVSHLSAGWPTGPSDEEDTLDQASICGRREILHITYTGCVGRKLRDGGMYGPSDTASLRLEVPIYQRR